CDPNKYGAGCLQDCHCQNESSCDRFTGECDSKGCLAGWNGNNCQIPDDCMDGYYGSQCTSKCLCYMDAPCDKTTGRCQTTCVPWFRTRYNTQTCQSCSAGLFGDSCTRECHCESDACDSVTGECVGCCKRQWLDGTNLRCQEGILNVTGNIVNPGVKWSSVTCWSRELTGNSTRYPVNLVRSLVSHDDSGVTLSNRSDSQSDDFTLRGWNYTIDNPQAGDQFYCWIPMSTAQLNATLSYYELLVLSNPPELLDVTSTSIDIRWAAWEEEIDVGDPPLVGYVVHIKEASSTLWTNRSVIINSLEYRLIHLEHDTNYTVSVSAVREGEMGEGPRGPPITVKTLCQVPTITPTNITATVTDINHLNITWQIENSGEEPIQLRVVPASTTWTIITEGLVPGLTYIFLVSLTTDLESSLGEASMAVTFPMPQSSETFRANCCLSTFKVEMVETVLLVYHYSRDHFLILFVFIISFIIYRRRKKANVLPPGQVQSFYNNDVRIDDETRVQDNINSLEMRTSYEKPGGSQTAGYEEDITKKSDEAGFDYEVPNEIRKPATSEITDHATDYDNVTPDDIEKSTGIYINIPTNKKTSPPRPIAISEFQSFMRRGKRSLITDVVKEFLALPMGQQYPCSEALRYEAMQNKSSHQIVPYPQSRIDSERFWRMILQQGVRTIVMLTDISNTDICYWPKKDSTKEVFGEMTVLLQDQSVYPHYTIRTLNAFRDNGDTILTVHQLQFHGWTHTGVPNDISNLVAFINQVKVSETSSKARPLLVHCRNGCGATGTFIALYILMDQMKENNTVSVYNVIRNLRKDRMDMVLTKLQYWFIYETLQEAQLMPNQSSLTADEMKGLEDQSLQDKAEREFKALSKIEEFHESPESLIGRAEVNSHKNRYPDIIPSDLCRPILKSEGITLGSNDYINATNVPASSATKYWPDAGNIPFGSMNVDVPIPANKMTTLNDNFQSLTKALRNQFLWNIWRSMDPRRKMKIFRS
ncbi:putative angiopoietin-1 receptor-like, partial [Apostichopus japonicus]